MTTRRLAAILAADVVGFSSLMGKDDEGTLARIKSLRREVVEPKVNEHHGRVFKTTGDGLLVEFSSPVEAVRCAVGIQQALAAQAAQEPSQAIQLRIGINLGDIMIEEDGDVYGDGVNTAARLEQIAEPGGISISGKVYEEVRDKLPYSFEDQGEKQVKNIARPVRVYSLQAAPIGTDALSVRSALPLPDRPSLAVLPFTNMSGDPEQEYFADGVVEEIITALSRVRWFFVIARNSSFTYKGRSVDIRQVGRELGVRYVLEGSIQKSGNRVRISGQLIEAASGRHVWADRFDSELADIFDLQDRITESVVGAIEPSLRRAEIERASAKRTEDLDAYDLYLRAMANHFALTRPASDEALRLLDRALELDRNYSAAKALAAIIHNTRVVQNWADQTEIERGIQLAREALADHRDDPTTLRGAAVALAYLAHDFEPALAAIDRALTLNPNSATAYEHSGWIRLIVSDWRTSIDHFQKVMRLSPLDPAMGWFVAGLSWALLVAGRPEEALPWARKAAQEMPTWMGGLRPLIMALVELGRLEEARAVGQRMLAFDPKYTIAIAAARHSSQQDPQFRERFFAALRAAGIPE
ncbi:adenylate cyclase (plasmid) [Microvirga ossetica]|uniref:Adenylate cyclase n=1 Tax=Microvirga ossetica TaxID=1882682 RepID=A0A1B2EUH1_9HYPH|nr:adenylate/guanylate cyclase domain-containing protein [Microvirga ossetica]ANY83512.1 adenylate cyclase [Microvirga ossetica]